ncbi:hypothetical protein [Xanthovirga aplysinae]|uniref:fluoroquinolone export ABC transporter permease subunit n=1 Tax=Xanthovirga aplysinae TaxID=2529853 RepID=UPI0012BD409C|nr:hypothetical protein [Xanthovirga aplysinae]MTI29814.1 ABC transporter permease [Xanthovirga aplysinae]
MKKIFNYFKWELLILHRNQLLTISIVVTLLYIGIFKILEGLPHLEKVLVLLIFNDPALIGFFFVGVTILFEKSGNILSAIQVSPLKLWEYFAAKISALSLIAILCSLGMALAAHGWDFNYVLFISGVGLTSLLFILSGLIIVVWSTSFNQFLMKAMGVLIGLSLPFLGYFGVLHTNLFYFLPTQGSIILLDAAFQKQIGPEVIYGVGILLVYNVLLFFFALKTFKKHLNF